MLDQRRTEVLRILVQEYIRSGEPVSSTAILDNSDLGVSSATVRNELAVLEADGYVSQPHTSAGRVPTALAYRYYVDHLVPTTLRAATDTKIAGFFDSVQSELSKLLKATSQLLADVTHLPAVVVAPAVAGERIRDVHLVHLTPELVLAMIVTEGGRVLQERLRLERPVTGTELADVGALLAANVVGVDLGAVGPLPEAIRSTMSDTVAHAADSVVGMISRVATSASDVFLGGTRQMAAVWEDLSEVQRVLEVIERDAIVLNILARAPGTSIQFGVDLPVADVDMAVVSATYDSGSASGSLGVIGPMRMNYRRAIAAVEEISRELEDRIQ